MNRPTDTSTDMTKVPASLTELLRASAQSRRYPFLERAAYWEERLSMHLQDLRGRAGRAGGQRHAAVAGQGQAGDRAAARRRAAGTQRRPVLCEAPQRSPRACARASCRPSRLRAPSSSGPMRTVRCTHSSPCGRRRCCARRASSRCASSPVKTSEPLGRRAGRGEGPDAGDRLPDDLRHPGHRGPGTAPRCRSGGAACAPRARS